MRPKQPTKSEVGMLNVLNAGGELTSQETPRVWWTTHFGSTLPANAAVCESLVKLKAIKRDGTSRPAKWTLTAKGKWIVAGGQL